MVENLSVKPKVKTINLHGHAEFVLIDKDGNEERWERDNLITSLPSNIFNHNISGKLDYSAILPLYNLFSGCILYNSNGQISSADANMTLIPSGCDIVAHAGDTAYSGANDKCGNPNAQDTDLTGENVCKFVWDWTQTQGNGQFDIVSLCNGKSGYNARNDVDALPTPVFHDIGKIYDVTGNVYNVNPENNAISRCHFFDFEKNEGYWLSIDGQNITVKVVSANLDSILLQNPWTFRVIDSFEVTVTNAFSKNISIQKIGNIVHIVEPYTATDIRYAQLNLVSRTATQRTISFSGTNFYFQNRQGTFDKLFIAESPIFGNYVYIKDSGRTSFYKCNLDNPADVVLLDTRVTKAFTYMGSVVLHSGNIIGQEFRIINDVVIPHQGKYDGTGQSTRFLGGEEIAETGLVRLMYEPSSASSSYSHGSSHICLTDESISTVNIQSELKNKTIDKSMRLTYTIRQEIE